MEPISSAEATLRRGLGGLIETTALLASATDPSAVLQSICRIARAMTADELAGLALKIDDSTYRLAAVAGGDSDTLIGIVGSLRDGPIGNSIRDCVVTISTDFGQDRTSGRYIGPETEEILPGADLGHVIAAPLMVRGEALGSLFTAGEGPHDYPLDIAQAIEAVARQTGIALDTARLLSIAREDARLAVATNAISKRIRSELDPTGVVQAAADIVARSLGAARCLVRVGGNDDPMTGEETSSPLSTFVTKPARDWLLDAEFASAGIAPVDESSALGRAMEVAISLAIDGGTGAREEHVVEGGVEWSILAAPIRLGQEPAGAVVVARVSGEGRWLPSEIRLLESAADELAGSIASARLLESQTAAVERLTDLDRLKDEFVSVVSHELRTPLTSIKGFTSTLSDNYDAYSKEDHLRYLEIIQKQADRLERLISEFLDVSRIQQGGLVLDLGRVDLLDAARLVARDMSAQALEAGREITVSGDAVVCEADREKVVQVISNYVSNALKYGRGTIEIEVAQVEEGGQIVVADAGPGVPAEDASRIFEIFFQSETGSTRRSKGVGLGLAIVKGLVTAHGGEVWYRPSASGGSLFGAFLPTVVPDRLRTRARKGLVEPAN